MLVLKRTKDDFEKKQKHSPPIYPLTYLSSICSFVKNAARLAVYDEITIKAKNHQAAASARVGIPLEKSFHLTDV